MSDPCNHKQIPREQIQTKIDQYGCFIIKVQQADHLPDFAYTIGLHQKYNHPEIICFGLKADLMHELLNDACELIEKGRVFETGQRYEEFLQDYTVEFLEVNESYYPNYLNYASWFYEGARFPALQLVWPDNNHLFPWEEGFKTDLKFTQPLLDRNMDFKFYEERNLGVYTTKHVLEGKPVLYVYHNEDADWQFHSEKEPDPEDGKLVSLEWLLKTDPSINEIFHLDYGESAWRSSKEDNWKWE